MDIFDLEKLNLFLIFFIPGFISMKIWSLLVARRTSDVSKDLLEIVTYSFINYLPIVALINELKKWENWKDWMAFLIVFIFPIIMAIGLYLVRKIPWIKNHLLGATATSWDYFFSKREACFLIIHLKDGRKIGGYWGLNSYASAFPNKRDIYIEQVWKLDDNNGLIDPMNGTKGFWVQEENIYMVEFFNAEEGGE